MAGDAGRRHGGAQKRDRQTLTRQNCFLSRKQIKNKMADGN